MRSFLFAPARGRSQFEAVGVLEKFRVGNKWRDCSEDRSVEGRTGGLLEGLDWLDGG